MPTPAPAPARGPGPTDGGLFDENRCGNECHGQNFTACLQISPAGNFFFNVLIGCFVLCLRAIVALCVMSNFVHN